MQNQIKKYVVSVLVENHAGVLSRVSGLFSRRGYSIDSLTVGETLNPGQSRMTIVVSGDEAILEQIIKQLSKLIEVISIEHCDTSKTVIRDMALIKVCAKGSERAAVIEVANIYRGRIVDVGTDSLVIEATGSDDKIESFIRLLKPYGIIELVRTGQTAMARGDKTLVSSKCGE